MIISQSGIVDIIPEYNRQLRPIFCVSEGDKNTRMINITVQQAGENFSIPSGASVYVTGKKQDNTIFTYSCTKSGYIVSFQIAEQMSAANGIVLCELQIIDGGNPLGSANFVYWVEPSPVANGDASESDLNVFLEAILGADKLDHFWANVEEAVTEAVEAIQIHEGQTVIDASLTVEGAAADAKATGDIVRAFMDALVSETTAEATIATCDDAAGGLPLKTLTANIVPTQSGSGDPSPTNVRPISGYTGVTVTRAGKNMLPLLASSAVAAGITYTVNSDGTVHATGTSTAANSATLNMGHCVLPPGDYIISGCPAGGASTLYRIRLGSGSYSGSVVAQEFGNGMAFTLTQETDVYARFYVAPAAGAVDFIIRPMIRPASDTDATFEPCTSATYAVNFPTAAGTVYGGALTVNNDGSGTLTVAQNTMVTFDGSENWTAQGSGATATYRVARGALPANANGMVCNMLIMDDTQTAVVGHGYVGTTNLVCYIEDASADNLEAWKAKLTETPMQIVYTLANPTTYALSAVEVVQMLAGVNNVWTDAAGTLTTEYYASTGLYVEKKVNAQRNMIAGVEEAMVATKNYARNDLLIVGNTLYKVTAAISSGAALVVGTNVTETTVAEQLLALA